MLNFFENPIALAVIAALFLGAFTVPYNIAMGAKFSPPVALLCLGVGTIIVALLWLSFYTSKEGEIITFNLFYIASLAGIIWAVGMVFVTLAMGAAGGNVSQIVPLYNTNTLVAMVLALIIFKEFQDLIIWKVLLGGSFIVIGGALVALAKKSI